MHNVSCAANGDPPSEPTLVLPHAMSGWTAAFASSTRRHFVRESLRPRNRTTTSASSSFYAQPGNNRSVSCAAIASPAALMRSPLTDATTVARTSSTVPTSAWSGSPCVASTGAKSLPCSNRLHRLRPSSRTSCATPDLSPAWRFLFRAPQRSSLTSRSTASGVPSTALSSAESKEVRLATTTNLAELPRRRKLAARGVEPRT